MNRTYDEWLKYYENATKKQVIEDMMLDIKEIDRLNNIINELEEELNMNLPFKVIGVRRLIEKLKELKENND